MDGLRTPVADGMLGRMTATLTLDDAGRLILPTDAVRMLGMQPGESVEVDVTTHRIDLRKDAPLARLAETDDGLLILAASGIPVDVAAAIRAERAGQAERALPREREAGR